MGSRSPRIAITTIRHAPTPTGELAWAHVSGWAQLSGQPRTVSCVLSCRDCAAALSRVLPELSDALTEAGFPWEITCIDRASQDATESLLAVWCELPGFRWIRFASAYDHAAAVEVGLEHSRGDAVVLIDVASDPPLPMLPSMIAAWDSGHEIVFVHPDRDADRSRLVCWNTDAPQDMSALLGDERVDAVANQFMLLDRRVVQLLLRGQAD